MSKVYHARFETTALLVSALLAGCGGGGGDSNPSPSPPPAPAPAPTPTPTPPPPPSVPPLSSTVVTLTTQSIGTSHWTDRDTSTGGQGSTVSGIDCVPNLSEAYHVHSHLSIFLDGVQLMVPAEIGIVETNPTTTCFYITHTHDHSGRLHVEAASPGTFTLGQFFAVWGQPLESTNIAGITGKPVRVFVTDNNGTVTESTSNWGDIELLSHREITIQIGSDITEVPNYTWPGN